MIKEISLLRGSHRSFRFSASFLAVVTNVPQSRIELKMILFSCCVSSSFHREITSDSSWRIFCEQLNNSFIILFSFTPRVKEQNL